MSVRRFRARIAPRALAASILLASFTFATMSPAEQVAVHQAEGLTHGFLALRTLDGTLLADDDLLQTARGSRVTKRLVFHFKDTSLHDETTVFSRRQRFRLLSDQLVQKRGSFPRPVDEHRCVEGTGHCSIHGRTWRVQQDSEHMDLPPDLANGLVLTLLKNADPAAPPKSAGFLAATPKPMLVKLAISAAGEESFTTAAATRKAMHYILKVDIGGIKGMIAPLIGKQPPDSHVWILGGEAPAFVKSEQPLYNNNGPVLRIELVTPVWPHESRTR